MSHYGDGRRFLAFRRRIHLDGSDKRVQGFKGSSEKNAFHSDIFT
jgi:hypothetical protein